MDVISPHHYAIMAFACYLILVRILRYRRLKAITLPFANNRRPLSSMTTHEAFQITTQPQSLEFPSAILKARTFLLLKAGAIPTMSPLFLSTGQNTRQIAPKRSIDTQILLRESQTQPRDSPRYMQSVARINYLHARYRKSGRILDDDLLHTIGDNAAEILRVVDGEEWRVLSRVERCALGIMHWNVGTDLGVDFGKVRGEGEGWGDGVGFLEDLVGWTRAYEERVVRRNDASRRYVEVYVDGMSEGLPGGIGGVVRGVVRRVAGADLSEKMRESLSIEAPGPILLSVVVSFRVLRKLFLRHLCLPRPESLAFHSVPLTPNVHGLYNFPHAGSEPWYMEVNGFWRRWSPISLARRILGMTTPSDVYMSMGYNLMTIGPEPQEGKGLDEMRSSIESMMGRRVNDCPFGEVK